MGASKKKKSVAGKRKAEKPKGKQKAGKTNYLKKTQVGQWLMHDRLYLRNFCRRTDNIRDEFARDMALQNDWMEMAFVEGVALFDRIRL